MGNFANNLRGIQGNGAKVKTVVPLRHLPNPVECAMTARPNAAQHLFMELQTQEQLEASYELRYQVYCKERGFLPEHDYLEKRAESDCHDHGNCVHFGAINSDGGLIGTNRLIISSNLQLPMRARCEITDDAILDAVRGQRVAEISRLAISRLERQSGNAAMVLGLYKIMYQSSKLNGVKYWFAAMERSLVRLLARMQFHFEPIGPVSDYYGEVQPYVAKISDIETAVLKHNPALFHEFNREIPEQMGWDYDGIARQA